MATILVVEDEESYREPLAFALKKDGYQVVAAADGEHALWEFSRHQIDLVLLDLMLPGVDGIEVCKRLREVSKVPIIMVTAKDEVIDRIIGLEIGADDYLPKPYSYRELLARVKAVLRRTDSGPDWVEDELSIGPVSMDLSKHQVTVNGKEVSMPLREYELLELLMRNPDIVLTRGQIIDRLWGSDYVGDTKTLDVHVKRVRNKIEDDPKNPQLIQTVRGVGYKFVSPSQK